MLMFERLCISQRIDNMLNGMSPDDPMFEDLHRARELVILDQLREVNELLDPDFYEFCNFLYDTTEYVLHGNSSFQIFPFNILSKN